MKGKFDVEGNNFLITVVIPHYNASRFLEVSLNALQKLTKSKFKVIICDNGSGYLEKRKLKKITNKYKNVELLFRKQSAPTSMGHAEALNILIEKINTPYGVILDSDAILLKKGWDEILINQIDNKTKIIGCPPVKNPIKPTNFPSVYATLFDSKAFKSLKIDMRPKNLAIGLDTGWEMQEKFLKKGYQAKVLEIRSTKEYKNGPFKDVICVECYFNDKLMASHFGRGSTLGMAKYYKRWRIPVIKTIVRRIRGYYERNKWLKTCKEIVNKESYG